MCARVYTYMHLSMNMYRFIDIPVYDGVLKIHTPINGKTPNIYDRSHDSTRFSSERLTSFAAFFVLDVSGAIRGSQVFRDTGWYLHDARVDRTFRTPAWLLVIFERSEAGRIMSNRQSYDKILEASIL